jgi:hypothetical protein
LSLRWRWPRRRAVWALAVLSQGCAAPAPATGDGVSGPPSTLPAVAAAPGPAAAVVPEPKASGGGVQLDDCRHRDPYAGGEVTRPLAAGWQTLAASVRVGRVQCASALLAEQWTLDTLGSSAGGAHDVLLWLDATTFSAAETWQMRRAYGRLLLEDGQLAVLRGSGSAVRVVQGWSRDASLIGRALTTAGTEPTDAMSLEALLKTRRAVPLALVVLGTQAPELPPAAAGALRTAELRGLQLRPDGLHPTQDEALGKLAAGVATGSTARPALRLGGLRTLLPTAETRTVAGTEGALLAVLADSLRETLDPRLQTRAPDVVWLVGSAAVEQRLLRERAALQTALQERAAKSGARIAVLRVAAPGRRQAEPVLHADVVAALRGLGVGGKLTHDADAREILAALEAAARLRFRDGALRRLVLLIDREPTDVRADWPAWTLQPEFQLEVLFLPPT